MGTVLHPLLNLHILHHLRGVLEAFSSRIRFLRPTARNLRILSSPYVPTIVCVLAFVTPLPDVCRLRQTAVRDHLAHLEHCLADLTTHAIVNGDHEHAPIRDPVDESTPDPLC